MCHSPRPPCRLSRGATTTTAYNDRLGGREHDDGHAIRTSSLAAADHVAPRATSLRSLDDDGHRGTVTTTAETKAAATESDRRASAGGDGGGGGVSTPVDDVGGPSWDAFESFGGDNEEDSEDVDVDGMKDDRSDAVATGNGDGRWDAFESFEMNYRESSSSSSGGSEGDSEQNSGSDDDYDRAGVNGHRLLWAARGGRDEESSYSAVADASAVGGRGGSHRLSSLSDTTGLSARATGSRKAKSSSAVVASTITAGRRKRATSSSKAAKKKPAAKRRGRTKKKGGYGRKSSRNIRPPSMTGGSGGGYGMEWSARERGIRPSSGPYMSISKQEPLLRNVGGGSIQF
ncbi:hypothetical protein ACHAXA_000636 [Cyclostephanos tholiformis]|uniref:Uncharacterized protein n=1 Tax=Cyclostephanos tholiformis TaxID=382380 RepID=A0ABD3SR06_9STRA